MVAQSVYMELIDPERLPNQPMRRAETLLKRQLFGVEDRAVLELAKLYREAFNNLRGAALELADQQGVGKLDNSAGVMAWRDQYMAYVEQRNAVLLTQITQVMFRASETALLGGYYGHLWLLDMATPEQQRINMPLLNAATALDALTEDVYTDLIQSLMGQQWRSQYANEIDSLTLEIRRAIGTGMLDGQGIADVMRRVAGSMGVETDRRRGAIGSAERRGYRANFNRVQAITRTTINEVSNVGAINAYQANKDIIGEYEWLTARDERVCPTCYGLDGSRYPNTRALGKHPPAHPNCRCTVIPVVRDKVLVDDEGLPRTPLARWTRGIGMERELENFLRPTGLQLRAPVRRIPAAPKVVTPVVKFPKMTPSGPAVGENAILPTKGAIVKEVEAARANIDAIHGDGALEPIPVKPITLTDANGYFKRDWNGNAEEIAIAREGDHKRTTFAHEVGHWLDMVGMGGKNSYTSEARAGDPGYELIQGWRSAIQASPEWQRLRDMKIEPDKFQEVIAGYSYGPNPDYVNYLMQGRELFARSYAQFIAEEAGDAVMLGEVEALYNSGIYNGGQWSRENFEPIRRAFREMFTGLGWMK